MAATDFETAVDQTITASNQLHEVVNGTSTETVTTDSGEIPSVRKALTDSMMYLPSVPWAQGEDETNLFQPRIFGDQIYWAPSATSANPVPMGVSPDGDSNWFLAPVSLNKNFVANVFNYDGLIYQGVGNISDFAGQQLQEGDKTNAYQYPDNSRQFYVADKSQTFPITIPADPSSDNGWALVSSATQSWVEVGFTKPEFSSVEKLKAGEMVSGLTITGTLIDDYDLKSTTIDYYGDVSDGVDPRFPITHLLTTLQRARDARGDQSWEPDGFGEHYLFGGADYVAILFGESIYLSSFGFKDDELFDSKDNLQAFFDYSTRPDVTTAYASGRGFLSGTTTIDDTFYTGAENENTKIVFNLQLYPLSGAPDYESHINIVNYKRSAMEGQLTLHGTPIGVSAIQFSNRKVNYGLVNSGTLSTVMPSQITSRGFKVWGVNHRGLIKAGADGGFSTVYNNLYGWDCGAGWSVSPSHLQPKAAFSNRVDSGSANTQTTTIDVTNLPSFVGSIYEDELSCYANLDGEPYIVTDIDSANSKVSLYPQIPDGLETGDIYWVFGGNIAIQGNNSAATVVNGTTNSARCGLTAQSSALYGCTFNALLGQDCGATIAVGRSPSNGSIGIQINQFYAENNIFDILMSNSAGFASCRISNTAAITASKIWFLGSKNYRTSGVRDVTPDGQKLSITNEGKTYEQDLPYERGQNVVRTDIPGEYIETVFLPPNNPNEKTIESVVSPQPGEYYFEYTFISAPTGFLRTVLPKPSTGMTFKLQDSSGGLFFDIPAASFPTSPFKAIYYFNGSSNNWDVHLYSI